LVLNFQFLLLPTTEREKDSIRFKQNINLLVLTSTSLSIAHSLGSAGRPILYNPHSLSHGVKGKFNHPPNGNQRTTYMYSAS